MIPKSYLSHLHGKLRTLRFGRSQLLHVPISGHALASSCPFCTPNLAASLGAIRGLRIVRRYHLRQRQQENPFPLLVLPSSSSSKRKAARKKHVRQPAIKPFPPDVFKEIFPCIFVTKSREGQKKTPEFCYAH